MGILKEKRFWYKAGLLLVLSTNMLTAQTTSGESSSIQIGLTGMSSDSAVSLIVINEMKNTAVYRSAFDAENNDGTDAAGNYARLIQGLEMDQTYSIHLFLDANRSWNLDEDDMGRRLSGIRTGESVTLSWLEPLGVLELTLKGITISYGSNVFCMVSGTPYPDANTVADSNVGFSSFARGEISDNGEIVSQVLLPKSEYLGAFCLLDKDNNGFLSAGDIYSNLSESFIVEAGVSTQAVLDYWKTLGHQ